LWSCGYEPYVICRSGSMGFIIMIFISINMHG
jgi:hypothetical protein